VICCYFDVIYVVNYALCFVLICRR